MTGENCLVCASDEGLFLDIVEQPTLKVKARNCKIAKVFEEGLSTKVCHKCAFEIDQCNKFVEKIKKANKIQNSKKACCGLCFETFNKEIFFDLSKQKIGVNNFIHKIQELFTEELKNKELRKQLICLFCRYCVDLLTDLRNLSDKVSDKLQNIIENGIAKTDFPKTNTSIVNRKTTYRHSNNLDLNTPSDTDSDTSSIMSSRRKVTKTNKSTTLKNKLLKCAECKIQFENGMDVYRFYHTGLTVCKKCWISIDPGKMPSKKRKKIDYTVTKLCSVLLKDVLLTNEEKYYSKETSVTDNNVFIIDDDSDTEIRTKRKISKTEPNHKNESNETDEIKKSKTTKTDKNTEDTNETEIESSKNDSKTKQNTEEDLQSKSVKTSRRRRVSEQSVQNNLSPKSTRSCRTRKESETSIKEDSNLRSTNSTRTRKNSEQSVQEIIEPKTRASRRRKDSEVSCQDESIDKDKKSNKNKKRLKSNEKETEDDKKTKGSRRRRESEQSVQEDSEINVDADSDSPPISKKAKKLNEKPESMSKSSTKIQVEKQNSSTTRKRGRSSSVESTTSKKSTRNTRKNNIHDLEEIIEIDDDSESVKNRKELTNEDVLQDQKDNLIEDASVSNDCQTDNESNASESKQSFKKETSKFKTPPKKKKIEKESTIKSIEIMSSESEEIDVLKSTDEETKEDLVEAQNEKSNNIELNSSKECLDKSNFDDCTSNKNKTEQLNNEIPKVAEKDTKNNLIEENKENANESNQESKQKEKSIIVTDEISELKDEENSKPLESDDLNKINDSDEIKEKPIEKGNDKTDIDHVEKIECVDDINEIKNAEPSDILKESKIEDKVEINIEEHDLEKDDNLEPEKEDSIVNRRSHKKSTKSRRSKDSEKRKSNKARNDSVEKIVIYDSSDSETIKTIDRVDETAYTCKICDKIYENKYIGLQHELTHMKTLKIQLQKVKIPTISKIVSDQESDANSDVESSPQNTRQGDEKMVVDVEVHEIESKKLNELEISEESHKNEIAINEIEEEIKSSKEYLESERNKDEKLSHELNKIEDGKDVNCKDIENETCKELAATDEQAELVIERETPKKQRSLIRSENKSDRKSRVRRKTRNANSEAEKESDTDKIAEAVQETLNDMAELHEKIQSTTEVSELNQEAIQNSTDDNEKENEIENIEAVENKENETDVQATELTKESENVRADIPTKSSKCIEEVITCDSDENNEESEVSTCIVDVDSESSKEVIEIENEVVKRTEESEVEVAEIDIADESMHANNDVEIEEIETCKNSENEMETCKNSENEMETCKNSENETEMKKLEHVVDLEQTDSNKSINEEDDIECVSEINITASEKPCVENNDENPRSIQNDSIKANNDDEDQTTEDEALAQASLEDLLERKEFQVIDELAESVTDGDEESEKEVNANLDKDADKNKEVEIENEIEIKISEAECTEILEVSSKSVDKQQAVEDVIEESQIIQDDGVIEEVIQDDDQPQSEVVQEVEVESNGNCLEITTNVREVLTEVLNERDEIEKRLGFQTEPISDDETDLMPETLENISKEIRNSQDMPSLDPIGEGIDDE